MTGGRRHCPLRAVLKSAWLAKHDAAARPSKLAQLLQKAEEEREYA
jgi:hypothetical protein